MSDPLPCRLGNHAFVYTRRHSAQGDEHSRAVRYCRNCDTYHEFFDRWEEVPEAERMPIPRYEKTHEGEA